MNHTLFNQIAVVVPRLNGWCSLEKAQTLAAIVVATRPKVCVEIGVYAGRSLFPVAMACAEIGYGSVVAIDSWDAKVSIKNEMADHAEWWGKIDHEKIYKEFCAMKDELKLNNIVVHRKKSDDVAPPENIGLLHIDGSHTDQAITDAERFAPNVVGGGIVVMDDIDWIGGGVRRAIDVLLEGGFVELFRVTGKEVSSGMDNNWGVFQRIK